MSTSLALAITAVNVACFIGLAVARCRLLRDQRELREFIDESEAIEPRCYCEWCRDRRGVHGEEAKALYQRRIEELRLAYPSADS
jgi:hypothetical protein